MARKPAWEVIMSVVKPGFNRPRFFSLHTLATLMGRKSLRGLARAMRKSGKVIGCHCPVVDAPVFYLTDYSHFTYEPDIWEDLTSFNRRFPYPKVRGFKAASGSWSSGKWGIGKYIEPKHSMSVPFVRADYAYANLIIDALREAGHKPGIRKYKVE